MSFFILIGISCSNDDSNELAETNQDSDNVIIPSELALTINIVGANSSFPNGDGSGTIQCIASAKDASYYAFRFGNGSETISNDGTIDFTYTEEGVNEFTVYVFAYSETNHSISTSKKFTLFVQDSYQLIWSDEFEEDGSISNTNWNAETIPPNNGSWWNGEKQHYTNRLDNVYVSNGTLKIKAKKESYTAYNSTKEYTSARITTQGKFDFTYGRIDVKAKLPSGVGTWPAIWMLGSNINTVGWPACGEIDIMEHWGHEASKITSAIHTTACSGQLCSGTPKIGETVISDYDKEFHVYSVIWTEEKIEFLIDDDLKYSYNPSSKNEENWPFTDNQFIILNIAMGGHWFDIDPNFNEATMEIDYVRVYQ